MTIAIALRVNDGVVLAADSAGTMQTLDGSGNVVVRRVFMNANKVANLRKGLPIGIVTWGALSIGMSSMATIYKDLRERFSDRDSEWHLPLDGHYSLKEVAERTCEFIVNDRMAVAMKNGSSPSEFGAFLVGYSSGEELSEAYLIKTDANGHCNGPQLISGSIPQEIWMDGQPDSLYRMLLGVSPKFASVLENDLDFPKSDVTRIMDAAFRVFRVGMVEPWMPIQDVIELGDFLADTCAKFVRFTQGHQTVGGTIELAAITKHEGFKWIRRKLYYDRDLNPEV